MENFKGFNWWMFVAFTIVFWALFDSVALGAILGVALATAFGSYNTPENKERKKIEKEEKIRVEFEQNNVNLVKKEKKKRWRK